MGRVLKIPTTRTQQAIARFHMEEDAFRTVLDVLVQWGQDDLVVRLFGVYRTHLRTLRRLAGGLLDSVEELSPAAELRQFTSRMRSFRPTLRRLPPKRDP